MSITNEQLAELLSTTMQQADRFKQKLAAAGFLITPKDAPPPIALASDPDKVTTSKAGLYSVGDELNALALRLFKVADEVAK